MRIIFGPKFLDEYEYEYEYYSTPKFWTNTNNIRVSICGRIWIRIFVIRIIFKYYSNTELFVHLWVGVGVGVGREGVSSWKRGREATSSPTTSTRSGSRRRNRDEETELLENWNRGEKEIESMVFCPAKWNWDWRRGFKNAKNAKLKPTSLKMHMNMMLNCLTN